MSTINTILMDCFGFSLRTKLLKEFFLSQGDNVSILISDFDHGHKQKRVELNNDYIYISTHPYHKNLSIQRLLSHWFFAKAAFEYAEKLKADKIYTLVPPNSMAFFARKYKKKHSHAKIYLDIIDLWPESLPVGRLKEHFPFTIWQNMRNDAISEADKIVTECDLYRGILKNVKGIDRAKTLYLMKESQNTQPIAVPPNHTINLCYLGSINNIIDIDLISKIISGIASLKPVKLHIIGDGENREKLVTATRNAGAEVIYYGKIYEEQKKKEIFDQCHFGLNIMKPQVCVGLTIKSLDYFEAGLPILNNIGKDTWELVENRGIGFNIKSSDRDQIQIIASIITTLSTSQLYTMREETQHAFAENFSIESFNSKLSTLFEQP